MRSDVRLGIAASWLIVGHVAFFMMAALWGIVVGGSRLIDEQKHKLATQVGELQVLLAHNEQLSARLRRANTTAADANEKLLRRIGADLHDGPAQLLSYTLLRLHKFAPLVERDGGEKECSELVLIRDALRDTLREIRNISEGLALPELEPIPLAEVMELAITSHERLTHTFVSRKLDVHAGKKVPIALKVCVYRLLQEGLANAFRHASGSNQSVTAHGTQIIEITVSDGGPGIDADRLRLGGLGLAGLRARIEAIGGALGVCSTPGKGTRLVASFDLSRIRNEEVIVG
jgi:signal transduction histidine kinase